MLRILWNLLCAVLFLGTIWHKRHDVPDLLLTDLLVGICWVQADQAIKSLAERRLRVDAATVLIRRGSAVIAVSRRDNHDDWGLPGGKRRPDESPEECALRELREETGVIVRREALREVFRGRHGDWRVVTYEAIWWLGTPTTQPNEGLAQWMPWSAIKAGCFGKYNQKLHEAIYG